MRAEPLRSAWPDERKPAGDGAFSIPSAHAILADLFAPNPWIYWTDLLVTTAIAYSAAAVWGPCREAKGRQRGEFR